MSKTDNVAVKFVRHWRGYNPSEVAGFDSKTAERLEAAGVVEITDEGTVRKRSRTKAATVQTNADAPAAPVAQANADVTAANADDDVRP